MVQLGTTLGNLEEMFMSKVATFQSPMYESNECYAAGYTQQTFHGHGRESSSHGGYETEFHNNTQDVPTYSHHTTPVEVAGNMAETVNFVQFADSDMYGPDVVLDNDENEMCDEENLLGGSDDDDDDEEDDVDAPVNIQNAPIPPRPEIPFFENIHMGGDFDISNRDVVPRFMAHLPDEVPLLSHPHRADNIWEDPDQSRTVVACRRGDSGLWDRPLDHRVLQCLLRAGFYGVYRIGHIRLDHPLITALVERWRTETHTFHFPTGEATVTLQDVSVLYGLRIDGRAVTGLDPSLTTEQWIALCAELLGVAPTPADLQADELVQQHARAYILWLIGGYFSLISHRTCSS
ncbi:hypothetical protein CsSME_00024961 [Camellia sinensis var. sinensis]